MRGEVPRRTPVGLSVSVSLPPFIGCRNTAPRRLTIRNIGPPAPAADREIACREGLARSPRASARLGHARFLQLGWPDEVWPRHRPSERSAPHAESPLALRLPPPA